VPLLGAFLLELELQLVPLLAPLLAANIPEFKVLLAASLLELEVQVPIFSIQLVAIHLEFKPPIWELNVLILGGWRSCLRRPGPESSERPYLRPPRPLAVMMVAPIFIPGALEEQILTPDAVEMTILMPGVLEDAIFMPVTVEEPILVPILMPGALEEPILMPGALEEPILMPGALEEPI
jgi:hypothetical protein